VIWYWRSAALWSNDRLCSKIIFYQYIVHYMDVVSLEKYLDYKPFVNKDPKILLQTILDEARKYLPEENIPLIEKAYAYADEKHA
jgi:hypothetical protein